MLCHSCETYVAQLWHYCRTIVRLSSHRCGTIVSRLCDDLKVKDIFLFLKDRQIIVLYTQKLLLFKKFLLLFYAQNNPMLGLIQSFAKL